MKIDKILVNSFISFYKVTKYNTELLKFIYFSLVIGEFKKLKYKQDFFEVLNSMKPDDINTDFISILLEVYTSIEKIN